MFSWRRLRQKYPRFVYEGFSRKIRGRDLQLSFRFSIPPDFSFSPKLTIEDIDPARFGKLKPGMVDNLVFHLGLIESFSYWKTTCSPEILVEPGFLSRQQIRWWQDLLLRGMGQYFFENQIDFRPKNFLRIINFSPQNISTEKLTIVGKLGELQERFLVPLGGGKDSVATLEILKAAKKEVRCFSLNPSAAVEKIFKIGECRQPVIVRRQLDPRLLALNRRGFLNGHTPFSAYLAFLSVLVAVIFDYKYIAFANERSANEGNVSYLGQIINHQYSKSFGFEQKFRKYCRQYLVRGVEYFSFLRPLYELQIAKLFSQYPQYFRVFLSCNRAQKGVVWGREASGKWCGSCPKCLFVFICLRPFLGEQKTSQIFGKNLLKDKKLQPLKEQLLGRRGFKPFECVGTARETRAALAVGRQIKKILGSWSSRHNLPLDLVKILKSKILSHKLPRQ